MNNTLASKIEPMERVMGIEPTLPAWEADILPLNYTRIGMYITNYYYIIYNKLCKHNV